VHGLEQLVELCRADLGDRGVRTHAARVGTFVAVPDPLVVARRCECQPAGPVADREERHLVALEQLFDHPALTERAHREEGRVELGLRAAHEDALAGCQPVSLDHTGRAGDGHRLGCGDAGVAHDLLRKGLGALDSRRGCAGAED
jgi:hypothetical protein